jgi:hypothetical protein
MILKRRSLRFIHFVTSEIPNYSQPGAPFAMSNALVLEYCMHLEVSFRPQNVENGIRALLARVCLKLPGFEELTLTFTAVQNLIPSNLPSLPLKSLQQTTLPILATQTFLPTTVIVYYAGRLQYSCLPGIQPCRLREGQVNSSQSFHLHC